MSSSRTASALLLMPPLPSQRRPDRQPAAACQNLSNELPEQDTRGPAGGPAGARIYLDHAGGWPLLAGAAEARASAPAANPASPHTEGRAARAALDAARDLAAAALGVVAESLVFCASGSEAVNLALLGAGRRLPRDRAIVTWAAEHQSVLAAVRQLGLEGHETAILSVDQDCLPELNALPANAGLVSLGLANNEVGVLQPVPEAARQAHRIGALFHLDACQGPQWLRPPLELADLASFSGHKLGAGGGGLLYAPLELRLEPLVYGGPQEWGRRAGREDVAAAAGVAAALEVARERRERAAPTARAQAERLRRALLAAGGRPTGGEPRLPGFATAAFAEERGEDLLLKLDLAGIAASSGSACASGSLDPSHVLLAMGLSLEEALGSLRLTTGYDTSDADIERAILILGAMRRHA